MDLTPEKKKKLTKWLIGIAAACILIFLGIQNIGAVTRALSWLAGIAMPLIVGCAIALIVNVPMAFFENNLWRNSKSEFWRGVRRPAALIISLLVVVGILVGAVAIVLPTLIDAVTVIVEYAIDFVSKLNSMSDDEIAKLPLGEILLGVDWDALIESAKDWLINKASVITGSVFGTVTSLVGGIIDLFVSIVFAIYLLFSKEKLTKQANRIVKAWFPKNFGEWSCHAASVLNASFKSFIAAQFFEALILGFLCFVGMLIFKFPYAAMVSVLVAVTALVPIVGAFVGGGIGAFMMLTVDPMKAMWFLLYFIILQQLEGNIIYPRTMGSRVKLPGMWILAAVTVGGGLGGPVGMLLSVPLASAAYVLFREATEKREAKNAKTASEQSVKTKAVLFDLDGTLLPMDQETFLSAYIGGLVKTAAQNGYDAETMKNAIISGTYAMVGNDGTKTNENAFWEVIRETFGESADGYAIFGEFYKTDFQKIRDVCGFNPRAREVIECVKERGLRTALATNPMFPKVATESRIRWAGLEPEDFEVCTAYEDSHYGKPNPEYYREVAERLGVEPSECLMVGNDVSDDMAARELGMKVFLLTDCLINGKGEDIGAYPHGGFDELISYINELK